jgi:hypothetical protein
MVRRLPPQRIIRCRSGRAGPRKRIRSSRSALARLARRAVGRTAPFRRLFGRQVHSPAGSSRRVWIIAATSAASVVARVGGPRSQRDGGMAGKGALVARHGACPYSRILPPANGRDGCLKCRDAARRTAPASRVQARRGGTRRSSCTDGVPSRDPSGTFAERSRRMIPPERVGHAYPPSRPRVSPHGPKSGPS